MNCEKDCWVAFNVFEGIGPLRFKLLLDYFGTAEVAYKAPAEKLREIGLGEKLVLKFDNFRKNFDIASYLLRVSQLGIEVLTFADKDYPKLLKEIANPPPVIYAKTTRCRPERSEGTPPEGDSSPSAQNDMRIAQNDMRIAQNDIFNKKMVAVVGTRLPTPYGRKVTEMIVEGLVASGLVVVSGLARGVDAIAHRTTIYNKGLTVGVLGCGLDKIYPPEHKGLAEEIVKSGGAVISEFPLGMEAVPGNFPARNRIISGLSLGVVVTEAAFDSGSLITASHAAEQGREVFAIPGPITSRMSEGTAQLMKKGAKVVTGVEDILEELGIRPAYAKASAGKGKDFGDLSDKEMKIITVLKEEDLAIDDIIRRTGLDSGSVSSLLSLMEIRGLIKNYNGVYSLLN